jgi:hypothetical protein
MYRYYTNIAANPEEPIDHNIEGQSLILFGSITSEGWLETLPIRFISFDEAELPITSSDRVVWRFAQKNQMI